MARVRHKDIVGYTFKGWTVIREVPLVGRGSRFLCRCQCGTEREVSGNSLVSNKSANCGCLRRVAHLARATKHGATVRGRVTPAYIAWRNMKKRCLDPKTEFYKHYGGRGIRICDRWLNSFISFYEDMGDVPPGLTLDRIDVNGNYEPDNCRWATQKEQVANQRPHAPSN